jgi:GT2 family glycosyltransferase
MVIRQPRQEAEHDGEAPFVSIVVPTCNRAEPLADCLASLVRQDYPAGRFEIVVVENGSTDCMRARLQPCSGPGDSPEIRFLWLAGRDANAARNAGVRASGGDPICLVDDDVVAPPGWLRALTAGAARHPEAGCLGGAIRPRFEAQVPRTCNAHQLAGTVLDLGASEREVDHVWGPNMAIPRRSFTRVGLFREGLALEQEWEWQQRLLASGGKIVYLPDAWLWHRMFESDLRVGGLLREHFRRGLTRGLISTPAPAPRLARAIRSQFAHGVAARCTRGLTEAARQTGMLCAHIAGRRPRP